MENEEEKDHRQAFLSLLNNEAPKTRDKGFVVFVHGSLDLSPIEELCFQQGYNTCRTVRYGAKGGHVPLPLIAAFLEDGNVLRGGRVRRGKATDAQHSRPTGHFRPDPKDSKWRRLLNSLGGSRLPGTVEFPSLEHLFNAMNDSLQVGDRLVLLCEVSRLDEKTTVEDLGFTDELVRFLYERQPERFGLVLSGVPEGLSLQMLESRFLAIKAVDTPVPGKTPERNQPLANDAAAGDDHLQITAEVNSLADAIAASDMDPPLVVSVLGGWGSGKSFVLHLLEKRLLDIRCEDLSDSAKKASFAYVGHPYLVHFNSWTYAKSNLWASLMQEILVQLNHQIGVEQMLAGIKGVSLLKDTRVWRLLQGVSPQQIAQLAQSELGKEVIKELSGLKDASLKTDVLWTRLRSLRSREKGMLKTLEETLAKKRDKLAEAQGRLEQDVDARMDALARRANWEPFLERLTGTLGNALKAAVKQRGKQPESEATLEDAFKSVELVKKIVGGSSAPTIRFLAFASLSVVGGIFIKEAGAGFLGGGAGLLLAGLDALRSANSWLEAQLADFDRLARAAQERQADVRQQLLEAKRNEPSGTFQNLNSEVRKLEAEIEVGRRRVGITARHETLLDFIRERLEQEDYEKHLGIIHRAQQDIEELSASLSLDRARDDTLFPRGAPRVILIIDDLDRCPPDRVVEVLEAAQLLVKTPLFVVVMAMDVRYVSRSLEKAYDGVLVRDGTPSGLDYIEKIVQIPYRVRPISHEAMPDYIQSQMAPIPVKERGKTRLTGGTLTDSGPPAEITAASDAKSRLKDALPIEVQRFDDAELGLLEKSALAVEISPRATKRLVNALKLIKIIWYRRNEPEPALEVKRALVLLLALAARYPGIMKRLLLELEESFRPNGTSSLDTSLRKVLNDYTAQWGKVEGRSADWSAVSDLVGDTKLLRRDVLLKAVGLSNVQLVRSFSFVGEVDVPPDPEMHEIKVHSPVEVQTSNPSPDRRDQRAGTEQPG